MGRKRKWSQQCSKSGVRARQGMETTCLEGRLPLVVCGEEERGNYLYVKQKLMAKTLASHRWVLGLFTWGPSWGSLRRRPEIRTLRCTAYVRGSRPREGGEFNPWGKSA